MFQVKDFKIRDVADKNSLSTNIDLGNATEVSNAHKQL